MTWSSIDPPSPRPAWSSQARPTQLPPWTSTRLYCASTLRSKPAKDSKGVKWSWRNQRKWYSEFPVWYRILERKNGRVHKSHYHLFRGFSGPARTMILTDQQSLIQIYPNDVTNNPEVYSLVVQKTWIQTGNLFLWVADPTKRPCRPGVQSVHGEMMRNGVNQKPMVHIM